MLPELSRDIDGSHGRRRRRQGDNSCNLDQGHIIKYEQKEGEKDGEQNKITTINAPRYEGKTRREVGDLQVQP